MKRIFINREGELAFLKKKYREGCFQLIVLYGRRRTGKTELIKKFSENKDRIYYLADKRGTPLNAKLFAKEAAAFFGDAEPAAENFDDVFGYIAKRAERRKLIVAIDEFSYLVEKDNAIPSVFQKIADNILKGSNIMLILCGSSIGMMERGVLSYKSPLYGRRTGDWKLAALDYKDAIKFFPKYSFEERIKAVLILGGIPAYLRIFDDSAPIIENIRNKLLVKGEFLFNEVNIVLQEELREPATYLKILESMGGGAAKIVDMASKSFLDAKDMPKYLNVLQRLEYVKKIHPITEKKPRSKKTLYKISDNFFNFWFNFIFPRKNELELGKTDIVAERAEKGLSSFLGRQFEGLCEEFLPRLKLPIKIEKLGPWWHKDTEIDLICLDESNKEALFIECKWSDLEERNARKILKGLKEKSKLVEFKRKNEYFGLIGKTLEGKEKLRKEGFVAFDLKDFERCL